MTTKNKETPPIQSSHYYDKSTIKKTLSLLEQGHSKTSIINKLKISRSTIDKWVFKYGSAELNSIKITKLTALQRRSIAIQVQQGTLTIDQANITYNINGHDTIAKWVRELKTEKCDISLSKTIRLKEEPVMLVGTDPEKDALKKALYEAQLKVVALDTLIDVAEEQLKINIRKKPGAKQSVKCRNSTQN